MWKEILQQEHPAISQEEEALTSISILVFLYKHLMSLHNVMN